MQETSYDPSALASTYQTASSAGQMFKNHIVQNDANAVVYNLFACLPMATLHNFFQKLPITRGLSVRLNLYLNTGITINETVTKANHVSITSSVIPRQTVPFMVSPISNDPVTGSGFSIDTAVTLQYQLKIGNSTLSNCRFYASMFNFNPTTESQYISSPERKILYSDVTQYVFVVWMESNHRFQVVPRQLFHIPKFRTFNCKSVVNRFFPRQSIIPNCFIIPCSERN